MRKEDMTKTQIAACLGAMLIAGCPDGEELVKAPTLSLDGAWTSCKTEEIPQDEWETFLFDGSTMQRVKLEYASSDGTCTGAVHGSVADLWSWTIEVGGGVQTTLEGVPVTARTLDSPAHHTIVYVDVASDPDALYLGDPTADPLKDGSTADARPTVLWAERPHAKDPSSSADAAALEGTWAACVADPAGDQRQVMTFHGFGVTITRTVYASTDGSCTGVADPAVAPAVFALRQPVTAALDGNAVTARELDIVDSGWAYYTLVFLDTAANPDVLYLGDDMHVARDGTAPEKRPNVLRHGMPHVRQ
jgi:hypothetical protein